MANAKMPPKMSAKLKRWVAELQTEGFTVIPPNYKQCQRCSKIKSVKDSNFYISYSKMNQVDGLMHICKSCLEEKLMEYMAEEGGSERTAVYKLCRDVDSVWSLSAWEGAVTSRNKTWRDYFKNINSLKQTQGFTFENSDPFDMTKSEFQEEKDVESGKLKLSKSEKRAREEIIEAIGRDPYSEFSMSDQKALYPELLEYLDEDTQENPFLVSQIIQITINDNTIKKLNETLSRLTKDILLLDKNHDKIRNMINNIKNLSATTTTIAKENGLAKKNSDSKKRSTLTGMMLYYKEIDIEDIEVDFYDQMTSVGMERVMKLSTKAIFDQGLFSDNDFEEMLQHSRALVEETGRKLIDLEEENRLLKKMLSNNNLDYKGCVISE